VKDAGLSPAVVAARDEMQNPRQLSDRIAMGRALWRDLVVGFAARQSARWWRWASPRWRAVPSPVAAA